MAMSTHRHIPYVDWKSSLCTCTLAQYKMAKTAEKDWCVVGRP